MEDLLAQFKPLLDLATQALSLPLLAILVWRLSAVERAVSNHIPTRIAGLETKYAQLPCVVPLHSKKPGEEVICE